jgi:hypothetical protein
MLYTQNKEENYDQWVIPIAAVSRKREDSKKLHIPRPVAATVTQTYE